MLTARGSWCFTLVLVLLGLAVTFGLALLALLCLTLLAWFLASWFAFLWRLRTLQSRLSLERTLQTAHGKAVSLWARQRVQVSVTLRCESAASLPYLVMSDRLPPLARALAGEPQVDGGLTAEEPLFLTYEIDCLAPGKLRFDGVKLQLADLQGFFTHSFFLRDVRVYRVLPALALEPSHPTFVKKHNALPLVGKHRFLRPGTGSELLELRDYLPGDPPKMIAWKASARRDRLMTRELESDVPIRCTLFVDMSDSVRVGAVGRTALCRLVDIAAGVAQANAAERDLTGLCLFDEGGVSRYLRPARGPKHFLQVIRAVTDAAGLMPEPRQVPLSELLSQGFGLAQDVYPDLLQADVNAMPWWLPLWSPQPIYTVPRRRPSRSLIGSAWDWLTRGLRETFRPRWIRFSPRYHRQYGWRKQLAAILSVRYGLGSGGLALLLEDDVACVRHLQRFLEEHQVAYPLPFFDDQGRYLYASPRKLEVVASALLSAIAHGKDNELFVLLVDLFEAGSSVEKLQRAVCLARARHHQVMLICPWPEGVPLPPRARGTEALKKRAKSRLPAPSLDWHDLLVRASTLRLHQAFAHVQQTFGRLGIPVICAGADEAIEMILHKLQRLRIHERGVR